MVYQYVAYTADNEIVKGTIDAVEERLAEEALENAGYGVISLKPAKPKQSRDQLFPTLFGVKRRDMIEFSYQLATLIESGIPLSTALYLLEEQIARPAFRKIITGLEEELQGGNSFSQALAKYPHVFPDIYRRIVEAGERSGNLEMTLRQASQYVERGTATTQKAKRAMIYPSLLAVVAIGVVVILMTVALPPLLGMFTELGAELPWTTSLLLAITGFLTGNKFYLLGMVILLPLSLFLYLRRPAGQMMRDKVFLKLPVMGSITTQANMALFSRTMSTLLSAGIPLPQIMDIIHQTTGNSIIRQAVGDVREGLLQGHSLSGPMAMNKVFPRLLVQMVTIGEQTDSIDSNMATLADFYEGEVNRRIDDLISMLEPVMTVIMGLVVGFIALSVIMPMYSVMGSIK